MKTSQRANRPDNVATGGLIGTIFGLIFIETNSGGLPGPWSVIIRIVGGVVGIALFVRLIRQRRVDEPNSGPGGMDFSGRRYWIIVAIEVAAFVAGLLVFLLVPGLSKVVVAWIALVVGVHFFGLGASFKISRFHTLGIVLSLLGIAGFVMAGLGASTQAIGLVSGVCSGLALFATVTSSLIKPNQGAN